MQQKTKCSNQSQDKREYESQRSGELLTPEIKSKPFPYEDYVISKEAILDQCIKANYGEREKGAISINSGPSQRLQKSKSKQKGSSEELITDREFKFEHSFMRRQEDDHDIVIPQSHVLKNLDQNLEPTDRVSHRQNYQSSSDLRFLNNSLFGHNPL